MTFYMNIPPAPTVRFLASYYFKTQIKPQVAHFGVAMNPNLIQTHSHRAQSSQASPAAQLHAGEYTRLKDIIYPLDLAYFLEEMANDQDFAATEFVAARAKAESRLIRHAAPNSSRFDMATRDAMGNVRLLDPNMADLEVEVENYLDYCSVRRREAELRRIPVQSLHFSRSEWERVRHLETQREKAVRAKPVLGNFLPQVSADGFFLVS
jgi:hypothetical protein